MSASRENLRLKESFLKEISVSDVMEELKAENYFDKAHREMFEFVKDSLPYKQMREFSLQHMRDSLTHVQQLPDEEGCKEKRRYIAKIGVFGVELNKLISKTLSDKLDHEAIIVAERTLKRLCERAECSNSMNDGGKKRKQNEDSSEISPNTNEQNKRFQKEDSDSFAPLDDNSNDSVSSVHTSDLSSFDDEIVVSSEDEKGEKRVKRISFKTAKKAYSDEDFSKAGKSMVQEKSNTDEASKKPKNAMPQSDKSKNSTESKNIASRPKRERKPNSRYSAAEMYL